MKNRKKTRTEVVRVSISKCGDGSFFVRVRLGDCELNKNAVYVSKYADAVDFAKKFFEMEREGMEVEISPSLPAVCVNCRNYDARRQYCPTIDSTICKGVAKKLKARGCDKWVAK